MLDIISSTESITSIEWWNKVHSIVCSNLCTSNKRRRAINRMNRRRSRNICSISCFVDLYIKRSSRSIIGDGNVLLDIKVNNDSAVAVEGSDEPGIKTNEILTKLLVSDGDIVVIGGIKKNTLNDSNSKTPGVSKVPVVGNLFKSKNKTDELVELLIFIAPRVIE